MSTHVKSSMYNHCRLIYFSELERAHEAAKNQVAALENANTDNVEMLHTLVVVRIFITI